MGDLPPMMLGNGYSGVKMGDLPPMMSENGYSGVKVCDLPPMVSGGDIAVSFFAGFMTQWWLDMGVIGGNRDDCDINRVKSVTALLKSKAETVKNGNAARLDV